MWYASDWCIVFGDPSLSTAWCVFDMVACANKRGEQIAFVCNWIPHVPHHAQPPKANTQKRCNTKLTSRQSTMWSETHQTVTNYEHARGRTVNALIVVRKTQRLVTGNVELLHATVLEPASMRSPADGVCGTEQRRSTPARRPTLKTELQGLHTKKQLALNTHHAHRNTIPR